MRKIILSLYIMINIWEFIPTAMAGDLTLMWDPPLTNTDGSPLTDLGGYNLYYGTTSQAYDVVTTLGNVTSWTTSNLSEGRVYYFAVTAYDISGNESDFSNEVRKTIHALPPGNIDLSTPATEGRVDGYDLIAMEMSLGAAEGSENWNPLADLDGNGTIDQQDLNILMGNFGTLK